MKLLILKFTSLNFKPIFIISPFKINQNHIGRIKLTNLETKVSKEIVEELVENGEMLRIIKLKYAPSDICLLPNGSLALTNYNDANITIHDKNLDIIQTVNRIDGMKIIPFGMTTDGKDKIYITEYETYSIIMTDLDFKKLNSYSVKNTEETGQYAEFDGICYSDEFIYVCDYTNKRVIKLTSNLQFLESFKVDYKPWLVKALGNTLCVKSGDSSKLCFYDKKNFELKYKYDNGNGRVSVIESGFTETNITKRKMHIFDENGTLTDTLDFNKELKDSLINGWDGCIAYFNGMLLLTSKSQEKLLTMQI